MGYQDVALILGASIKDVLNGSPFRTIVGTLPPFLQLVNFPLHGRANLVRRARPLQPEDTEADMRRGEAAEAWRGILARQKKLRRAAALETVVVFGNSLFSLSF